MNQSPDAGPPENQTGGQPPESRDRESPQPPRQTHATEANPPGRPEGVVSDPDR
jgi:hypothetical protein